MASTGSLLRELREQRGITLEDLARSTRINPRFLAALEMDDLAALPAGPFARGFIQAYCQALGESAEAVLAQCPVPSRPSPTASGPRGHRLRGSPSPLVVSLALFLGLGLALAAVTSVLKPSRDGAPSRPAPANRGTEPAPPYTANAVTPGTLMESRSAVAAPNPPGSIAGTTTSPGVRETEPGRGAPQALTSRPAEPTPRLSPTIKAKSYRLVARASQATRIRLRLDGRRIVEETIPAGAVREWISTRPFELRIANAGGVTLELNGRVLPPLGAGGTTMHRLVLPAEAR